MKANEFIQKFGWGEAVKQLNDPKLVYGSQVDYSFMDELNTLVEAKELVDSFGGLEEANKVICNAYNGSNHPIPDGHEELSIAIQLVETIENVSLVESVNA